MMRSALLLYLACSATLVLPQGSAELLARHQRIGQLFSEKAYDALVREIELQRVTVQGEWKDSLYTYIYQIGRAKWKTAGAEAAARSAEELYAQVIGIDHDPIHHVKAAFQLGSVYRDIGSIKESVRIDSTAVVIAERYAALMPLSVMGEALYLLGMDHADKGDHKRAIPLLERSVEVLLRAEPPPNIMLSRVLGVAGGSHRRLGHMRDAERCYTLALEQVITDTSTTALSRQASMLGNLGILMQSTGDLQRSKAYYHRSNVALNKVIERSASDPVQHDEAMMNRARISINFASVYFAMGDLQRSREMVELSLRDRVALLGPEHPNVIQVNEGFAELESMSGNLDRAEKLFRDLLVSSEQHYGRNSNEYTMVGFKLARVIGAQGRYAEADSIFLSIKRIAARINDPNTDLQLAGAFADRADRSNAQGGHDDAIADLLRSKAIKTAVHGAEDHRVAEAFMLISGSALLQRDTLLARQYADSALLLLQDRLKLYQGPYVPVALRNPYLLADAIQAKVNAERVAYEDVESIKDQLDRLDVAITSLQRNRIALSDGSSQLLLLGSQKRLFDLALDLAFTAYLRTHDEREVERLLGYSESDRSILLKSRLNEFSGLRFAGVPDHVLVRERGLLDALKVDPKDRAAWDDLFLKEKEYTGFLDSLRRDHPQYFELRYSEPDISLKDIRDHLLTEDRQMLVYAKTVEYLYIIVVGLEEASIARVNSDDLADVVHELNSSIVERNTTDYLHAAFNLYEKVIAPVSDRLTKKELVIVPDGELHAVNFETLIDQECTSEEFIDHLLLQDLSISYLLSVTTALQFADLPRSASNGMLALAPGFSDEQKQNYVARNTDTTMLDHHFLSYVRQPFAVNTVHTLGQLLSAKVLVGEEANESGFRELAQRYGILHLGTHAEMNATSPMYSRLVLSKSGNELDADNDGYLHAYEIYELDLHARLAVLTACETGAGKSDAVEGVRSLGYSFAYAGCPSMVMSLWKIDEQTSSEIITRFYANLSKGQAKNEALRNAKLDFLNSAPPELRSPYYWAGIVLVGDTAPVELAGGQWSWWWLVGPIALLTMFFAWRSRSRSTPPVA